MTVGHSAGADPTRIQTCSAVFRQIRDASDGDDLPQFRIVTDRAVSGRSFEELLSQRFQIGVGDDLTELPLLDMLFVYEMIQHDVRNRDIPEGHRRTIVGIDEISESTARKLLDEIQKSPGIEVHG